MRCRDCEYFGQYDDRTYVCDNKNMKTIFPTDFQCEDFKECSIKTRKYRELLGLFNWVIDRK